MNFEGKIIIVTGSSRGIGAAIGKAFAAEGGTVIINYIQNKEAADEVVKACKELGGDASAIKANVTSSKEVQDMVNCVLSDFGRIDVIVNNAFRPYKFDPDNRKMFWDLAWKDYQDQIKGVLFSTYAMCQAVLPNFKKNTGGSIVNVASDLVAKPTIPYHEYATAKSALIGFTRNLAMELGPLGIRVNCVAPGFIKTNMSSKALDSDPERKNKVLGRTPMGKLGEPADIGDAVFYYATDLSKFTTGTVLPIDGGNSIGF